MVVFTGFIAFFTFTMWRATERLWVASQEQGESTQAALTATERAFVFPAGYDITKWQEAATGKMLGLGVTLRWHNSGTTPTKNLVSYLNRQIFPADKTPEDTNFADLPGMPPPQSMIGPKATISGETGNISPQDLADIQAGRTRYFVWGWAEYNDVFPNTKRHRTEVCHELIVVGDLANPDAGTFTMRIYKKFNQADDDCHHAPKT